MRNSNFRKLKLKYCVCLIQQSLTGNYLLKVNNKNTRKRFEICSKFTIKTAEPCHWRFSGVFIVNF